MDNRIIPGDHFPPNWEFAIVPKLRNHWSYQPPKQSHVEVHPMQTLATSGNYHGRGASSLQYRNGHLKADIQHADPQRKVPTTPTGSVRHRFDFEN